MKSSLPLIVDLDGTLIKSDLLFETLFALIKQSPLQIFLIPYWLMKGRAYLKYRLAKAVEIDIAMLPLNNDVIHFLNDEKRKGRELVLATASSGILANSLSEHLGLFREVMASDKGHNLSAGEKLKVFIARYGKKEFDYVGNSRADLTIFPYCRHALLVNPGNRTLKKAQKAGNVQKVFPGRGNKFLLYINTVRSYQWLKNLLLFVPLFTAHQWNNLPMIITGMLGFTAFSLCASGGYIFNDLLDLPSDRHHPRKRNRPLASGDISLLSGSALMAGLPLLGLAIAIVIEMKFFVALIIYLALTLAYTLRLKTYVLVDVLVLAGLYTIRVIAGGEAVDVFPSFWLIAFSIFIFYSLALIKRCSELFTMDKIGSERAKGRAYRVSDSSYLHVMGIASGYLAIIVVALYVNSPDVTKLYSSPRVLWLLCPLLLHWISRLWLITGRGEMTDDPIIFALRDRISQYIAIAAAGVIFLAI